MFDRSIPFADNIDAQIFFVARLPRVLAAALVGSALARRASCFRRCCAIRSRRPTRSASRPGASLGAMMAITFNFDFSLLGISAVPLASFAGSFGALGDRLRPVHGKTSRDVDDRAAARRASRVQALLSAVIAFVQYLADFTQTFRNVRWLMGSLDVASYAPIGARARADGDRVGRVRDAPRVLDLISVGSESAAARGVNVERTERVALVSASLATGAAVSLAGPVSFVGIVVPHLVRLIVGADHRLVLPASALFGGAFLIGCDLVARTIIAPLELPVGIVTAIIGGPVFLWLLFRRA